MLRSIVKFVLIAEAYAVLTYAFGWWAVPVFAFVLGATLDRPSRPVGLASLCAFAGWASLLLLDAARGPVGEVAVRVGGVMHLPGFALILITLLFPVVLAWSAASLGGAVRDVLSSRRRHEAEAPAREAPDADLPQSTAGAVVADR